MDVKKTAKHISDGVVTPSLRQWVEIQIQQCADDAVYDALRQERTIAIGINAKLVTERDDLEQKHKHSLVVLGTTAIERDGLRKELDELQTAYDTIKGRLSRAHKVRCMTVKTIGFLTAERDELKRKLDAAAKPEAPEECQHDWQHDAEGIDRCTKCKTTRPIQQPLPQWSYDVTITTRIRGTYDYYPRAYGFHGALSEYPEMVNIDTFEFSCGDCETGDAAVVFGRCGEIKISKALIATVEKAVLNARNPENS